MERVVIYTPLEDIMYNQGGMWVVLAVVIAGIVGAGVYALIERRCHYSYRPWGTARSRSSPGKDFLAKYNGVISVAAGLVTLYVIHLANVKGIL